MKFKFKYELGYSENPSTYLGLYQPVLGCFLLTLDNLTSAQEIVRIASSRYNLYIVDLLHAKNYHHNIIDNDCCENWKLSNLNQIQVGIREPEKDIILVKELVPCVRQDPDINEEKKYLQLVRHYIEYINHISQTRHMQLYRWIDDVVDVNLSNDKEQLFLSIKRILYLETDNTVIENMIQHIINKNKELLIYENLVF